jgi:zinc protease
VGPPLFRGSIDKVVRKGIAPQSQTLVLLAGQGPWSREAAWQLTSLGELLEMRLLDRLRESLGGTYSVSVNTGYSRALRQEWQLTISYGSDPAKADTMYQAVVSVLDSLRRVPPSADEVERVREQQRRALEVQRKQNGYWMAAIRGRAEYGEPLDGLLDDERLISAVTPAAMHEAANAYLGTPNRARFVLLPTR